MLIFITNLILSEIYFYKQNEYEQSEEEQEEEEQLSPEELEKQLLEKKKQREEDKKKSSNFIKFDDGETKVLDFIHEMPRDEMVSYGKNKDGTPKEPRPAYIFRAKELFDKDRNEWSEVREWTCAHQWGDTVIDMFLEKFFTLKITRKGSGVGDTNYSIVPYVKVSPKQQH